MEYDRIIRERLSKEELLCQLAEEAAELSQAALKLRRILSGVNPTPVTRDEAFYNLLEEMGDVQDCFVLAVNPTGQDMDFIRNSRDKKMKRWVDRLEEKSAHSNDLCRISFR